MDDLVCSCSTEFPFICIYVHPIKSTIFSRFCSTNAATMGRPDFVSAVLFLLSMLRMQPAFATLGPIDDDNNIVGNSSSPQRSDRALWWHTTNAEENQTLWCHTTNAEENIIAPVLKKRPAADPSDLPLANKIRRKAQQESSIDHDDYGDTNTLAPSTFSQRTPAEHDPSSQDFRLHHLAPSTFSQRTPAEHDPSSQDFRLHHLTAALVSPKDAYPPADVLHKYIIPCLKHVGRFTDLGRLRATCKGMGGDDEQMRRACVDLRERGGELVSLFGQVMKVSTAGAAAEEEHRSKCAAWSAAGRNGRRPVFFFVL